MLKGDTVFLRPFREEDLERIHMLSPESLDKAEDFLDAAMKKHDYLDHFAIEIDGNWWGFAVLEASGQYTDRYFLELDIRSEKYRTFKNLCETVKMLLKHYFRFFPARRIGAEVFENDQLLASVFDNCGFKRECRIRERKWLDGSYRDLIKFGILRREWEEVKI